MGGGQHDIRDKIGGYWCRKGREEDIVYKEVVGGMLGGEREREKEKKR